MTVTSGRYEHFPEMKRGAAREVKFKPGKRSAEDFEQDLASFPILT